MKYLVTLQRTDIYRAEVEVEAESEEAAEIAALADDDIEWEPIGEDAPDAIEVSDIEVVED